MGAWLADNANTMWALTLASILALSLMPEDAADQEIGSSWIWNFGHVPAYAVFAGITALALSRRGPLERRARLRAVVAITLLAAAVELVQPLVGRTASLGDIGAGTVGAVIGMCIHALTAGKTRRHTTHEDRRGGL